MFVEKVCQVSPFPPLLLVLLILFIPQQHSRQPLSTGLSLHQVGACRDHRRADLTKLLERPAYTRCLPSSPPISSSTHCFLTRSTPWKGSHQVTPLHWKATGSPVGRGLAGSAEELQMEVEEETLMGPTTPDPSLLPGRPLAFFLVWADAITWIPAWEGTSNVGPQPPPA
nr:uncharacterized protein LOC105730191 isoform X2 [Aotus nancymaae]